MFSPHSIAATKFTSCLTTERLSIQYCTIFCFLDFHPLICQTTSSTSHKLSILSLSKNYIQWLENWACCCQFKSPKECNLGTFLFIAYISNIASWFYETSVPWRPHTVVTFRVAGAKNGNEFKCYKNATCTSSLVGNGLIWIKQIIGPFRLYYVGLEVFRVLFPFSFHPHWIFKYSGFDELLFTTAFIWCMCHFLTFFWLLQFCILFTSTHLF